MNDDATIISRLKSGETELFAELYDRYIDEIYRFIHWRVRHREISEDITSQVFIKALEHIGTLDVKLGGFRPWIYRIARNAVTDHWRTKKDHADISGMDVASGEDVAGFADIKRRMAEVEKYLSGLDEVQRDIIVLRVWDGLSYREISSIVGKSEENCRVAFSRAMSRLRADLAVIVLFLALKNI